MVKLYVIGVDQFPLDVLALTQNVYVPQEIFENVA